MRDGETEGRTLGRWAGLLAAAGLAFAGGAGADEASEGKRLDDLQRQINEINKHLTKEPEAAKKEEKKDEYPRMKLFGTVYAEYAYEFGAVKGKEDRDNTNAFDITRAYIGAVGDLSDDFKGKVTIDASRGSGAAPILKHAWLSYTGFKDAVVAKDVEIVFGLLDTPWLGFEEGMWGYRMQGTMLLDREGYQSSADKGIGVKGKIPNGYGSFHVDLVNGEGYSTGAAEPNSYKSVQGRLSVAPLAMVDAAKGFQIHGYVDEGQYNTASQPRQRMLAGASYQNGWLTLMAYEAWARDQRTQQTANHPSLAFSPDPAAPEDTVNGQGSSVWGVVNGSVIDKSMAPWSIISRWDHWDPDGSVIRADAHDRYINGIAYKWNKNVRFLLNYEHVQYQTEAGSPAQTRGTRQESERVAFTTEFTF